MIRTLIRSLFLGMALLCFIAAAIALGLDAIRLSAGNSIGLIPLGEFWTKLDPHSLEVVRSVIDQAVWEDIGVWLLLQPAAAALGAVGCFFLILRPMKERRRGKFS